MAGYRACLGASVSNSFCRCRRKPCCCCLFFVFVSLALFKCRQIYADLVLRNSYQQHIYIFGAARLGDFQHLRWCSVYDSGTHCAVAGRLADACPLSTAVMVSIMSTARDAVNQPRTSRYRVAGVPSCNAEVLLLWRGTTCCDVLTAHCALSKAHTPEYTDLTSTSRKRSVK